MSKPAPMPEHLKYGPVTCVGWINSFEERLAFFNIPNHSYKQVALFCLDATTLGTIVCQTINFGMSVEL